MTLGHVIHGYGERAVIVLHEWLGDASNYDPLYPYLDATRLRFCFADLRGYGRSMSLAGAYSLDEACADVLELADTLECDTFDLIGHSMSGLIVQRLALIAPARVRSVVAITPVFASGFALDQQGLDRMRAVAVEDIVARQAIADRTGHRYGDPWLNFKLARSRTRSTEDARLGYLCMFTETNFAHPVQGLPVRMLVISGQFDIPPYRQEVAQQVFGGCYPNCQFAMAEGAGHYPMLETPVCLAARLNAFLCADT
jgi:pimeloyl-ACP methyl ester carboxylesterase